MGPCECCRWPVNACRMARMVKLLPVAFTGLVLFLTVHSFYNDAVITGTLLLILFFPVMSFPRKPLKLPPGPCGVPFLGYLPFLGEKPHLQMTELARKYGPLLHVQLGSHPGIVVANARLAKEVLMTLDQVFSSHPDSWVTWAKNFEYYKDSGVPCSMGTAKPGPFFLRNMRRLVGGELMSPQRIEFFRAIRNEEMDALVQGLLSEVQSGKQIVDFNMAIAAMATNVMTHIFIQKRYYGKDASPETEKEAYEFQKLMGSVPTWAGRPFLQDLIPGLRPLMSIVSTNDREMAKIAENTDTFFKTIVQEHRLRQNTVESSQDFMDVLIRSVGEDGKRLDDKAIKAITMEMLTAGTKTIGTTIEWALAEVVRHPHVQRKLQAELDAAIGTRRMAHEADIPNLTYLRAVVRETVRLHPAAPLLLLHGTALDLGGYHIPARSRIVINAHAIGRDPALWFRPETFDPDRFTAAAGQECCENSASPGDNSALLLPIACGRVRTCPALRCAAPVVSLAVARLVHGFRWCDADDRVPPALNLTAPTVALPRSLRCAARLPVEAYYRHRL